jgi:hypothetical protein
MDLACPSFPLTPTLFIAREVSLLAEADFQEDQEQAPRQSGRHQDDCENFARHPLDQGGTSSDCDDQRGCRAKRSDA